LLAHSGCSHLVVIKKDLDTPEPSKHAKITVTFNKDVDRSTIISGTSLILAGEKNPNANGLPTWTNDQVLVFESNDPWFQIAGQGGTDTSLTLTLKSTVKAKDGSQMEQCKTGNPGTEPPGDCVLFFVPPG